MPAFAFNEGNFMRVELLNLLRCIASGLEDLVEADQTLEDIVRVKRQARQ
jgi:hypothetical protein